ncbi:MAG: IS256 family transposase [Desulfovibrio sp.]|nr:IS256 family transposase [Desulfovibrio sp.]
METTPNGKNVQDGVTIPFNEIVNLNEEELKAYIDKKILQAVQEVLNAVIDAEADEQCGAGRYQRSGDRQSTRAGHYDRQFATKSGSVTIHMPKLRDVRFSTAVFERWRRREASLEEAFVEMYLAGVSTRRVNDITEALTGGSVSASTVSRLNKKAYAKLEEWRTRPLNGPYPYVYLDGVWGKAMLGDSFESVSILVAIGVNSEGRREIIGVAEGCKEDAESWRRFLRGLKDRGLGGVRLVVSDKASGLQKVLGEFFPKVKWQRCAVHFYRNVLSMVPKGKAKTVANMLKAIHAQESREEAIKKAKEVVAKLREIKLEKAALCVENGAEDTFSYYYFPCEHWRYLRTNNNIERINREIRRRLDVVGTFPDLEAALMLATARLKFQETHLWGKRQYMDMSLLSDEEDSSNAVA